MKPDDLNMADVFVYSGVAIAAGTAANRWPPNLARISFFYLSVPGLFPGIKYYLRTNTKRISCSF